MIFAGSYTAGSLNITPITNQAFIELQANPSFTPDQAFASVAGKLGITTTTAKADVVADSSAEAAMYQVLSAGTTGTTLPDGNYEVKFYLVQPGRHPEPPHSGNHHPSTR